MSLSVLVVGGAGYIGSHMVKMLDETGHKVTVFDNLSRGYRDSVLAGTLIKGDLRHKEEVQALFKKDHFDVVMHFAALAYVGESVDAPRLYYDNNVTGTLNLLAAMLDAGVNKFVFSSSCAVYGVPKSLPITEDMVQKPINPYGWSKLMVEKILADYGSAYGLGSIALRYFNAAGCDPGGMLGERHEPETHLIPLVAREALRVLRGGDPEQTGLAVFGDNFPTSDGSCIRDYVHVTDLCMAHLLAMRRLIEKEVNRAEAYNLGNGQGFSVKEVIDVCRAVTGVDIRHRSFPPRPGDPPRLVGSTERARAILDWNPQYTQLENIISTAWRWIQKNTC